VIYLSFIILLTSARCDNGESSVGEKKTQSGIPACINETIAALKAENVRNPPASVWELTMDSGQTYYYIPAYCCDMYSDLLTTDCEVICHPDGGFTGKGSGDCPDISSAKKTLIWQDERTNQN